MAKKKAGKSTMVTKKTGKKKTLATGTPGVGAITIEPGNVITLLPDKITVNPNSDVSFIIANQDGDGHLIWIDPSLVVIKDTTTKKDPFRADIGKKNVPAGEIKVITLRTKAKASFPHSVTLKYTVQSFVEHGEPAVLDPDLEVSP